jgi:hypothetical protein
MSNISNHLDEHLYVHTNESESASMLVAPLISCWETGRWELIRAELRSRAMSSMHRSELSPPNEAVSHADVRGHASELPLAAGNLAKPGVLSMPSPRRTAHHRGKWRLPGC